MTEKGSRLGHTNHIVRYLATRLRCWFIIDRPGWSRLVSGRVYDESLDGIGVDGYSAPIQLVTALVSSRKSCHTCKQDKIFPPSEVAKLSCNPIPEYYVASLECREDTYFAEDMRTTKK